MFMTKWNFMLSWVEHEKSFITSGPESVHFAYAQTPFARRALNLLMSCTTHYENTPIQLYRKFHLQKLKIFW